MTSNDSLVAVQCEAVAQAVRELRATFRSSISGKNAELADRFWMVQDQLHRLLTTVADDPATFPGMSQSYPRLISEVLDALSFTEKTTAGSLPAIRYSCSAIHDLLFQLQNVKHSPAAAG